MPSYEIDWEGNWGSFMYHDDPIDKVRLKAGRLAVSTRRKIKIYTWTGGFAEYKKKSLYATLWYDRHGDVRCKQGRKTYLLNEDNGKLKEL